MLKKNLNLYIRRNFTKTFPVSEQKFPLNSPIQISPPKYTTKKLTNGIKTLIETPEIPKYITINIFLKGGLLYENSENSGYYKWLENSIIEKISNFPRVEINTAIKLERDGLEITSNMLSNQVEEYLDVFSSFFKPDILNSEILDQMEFCEEENKDIQDLLIKNSFDIESYGKPIVGLKKNYDDKMSFSFKARELHSKVINAEDIIISAGGIYNIDKFTEILDEKFSFIPKTRNFEVKTPLYTPKNIFLPSLKKNKQFFHSETDMFANQVGLSFKIPGQKKKEKYEKYLLLNELIGESSYFISEGPGKGVYLLAADTMRNCYPASEVSSFFKQYENTGVFGIYLKGIENSQSILTKGLINLIESIKGDISEDYFFRARNILKRKFMQNLENQFERIPVITKRYVYTEEIGFERFFEKIDSIEPCDLEELVKEIFQGDRTFVGIGPMDERSFK